MALLGAVPKNDELGKNQRCCSHSSWQTAHRCGYHHQRHLQDLLAPRGTFDRAARMAAAADEPEEMNYIRKHVLREMEEKNCSFSEASNRVFSNAPGSYGANVNHLVESSSWEEEEQLADAFLSRKSFAVTKDGNWQECPGSLPFGAAQRHPDLPEYRQL